MCEGSKRFSLQHFSALHAHSHHMHTVSMLSYRLALRAVCEILRPWVLRTRLHAVLCAASALGRMCNCVTHACEFSAVHPLFCCGGDAGPLQPELARVRTRVRKRWRAGLLMPRSAVAFYGSRGPMCCIIYSKRTEVTQDHFDTLLAFGWPYGVYVLSF